VPTVVVVNDDKTQLRIFAALLEKGGYNVHVYEGAEDALEGMQSLPSPADLIVTDLHMPGIDGWRFCRLLRSPEYSEFNDTPLLVVSATFAGEDPHRITAELGANAFLPSPVSSSRFLDQVRTLLAGETPQYAVNVLIVEDDKDMAELLERGFRRHGYAVTVALTGAEGIRLFREMMPEIVVADYHLPDMQGDVILEQVKRLSIHAVSIEPLAKPPG